MCCWSPPPTATHMSMVDFAFFDLFIVWDRDASPISTFCSWKAFSTFIANMVNSKVLGPRVPHVAGVVSWAILLLTNSLYLLLKNNGRSFLYMLLGLLTALSYSDLVKSWRGECGGGGIVGNHVWVTVVVCTCMLSCTPHKVFAWALGFNI